MKRPFLWVILPIYLIAHLPFAQARAQHNPVSPPDFANMSFLVGTWDYEAQYMTEFGDYVPARFRTNVYHILEGAALQEDFSILGADGNVIPLGATVRTYDAASGKWRMLWFAKDLASVTQMEGTWQDGEYHFEGHGRDARGEYLERITFYDISEERYAWKMDRSYDDGASWLKNFFSYTATKVKPKSNTKNEN